MPKIIVIDWDSHQVRVLAGEARGSRVLVGRLATLAIGDEHEAGASDAFRRALADVPSGAKVIGLVGRTQAVLRDLHVPNCPPEELPGIVRFQAMRELSFQAEQAAIDYEVIGAPDADRHQRVILAALQHDVVARLTSAAAESKISVSRLGLRPYATLQAYTKLVGVPAEVTLVVSLAGESLELTVARGETVLFSRGTMLRAASDSSAATFDRAAALTSEVRRTLAAFANQMPGAEVARIVLAACPGEHEELSRALAEGLPIPVERFDPFGSVELARELRSGPGEPGEASAAFVAAIGAVLTADEPWPIDFLNPKKPVARRDPRRPRAALIAAAALVVVASGYFAGHYQIAQAKAEIQRLSDQQAGLKEKVKAANEALHRYQVIEEWLEAETNALTELRRLTEQYPNTRQMYVTDLTITRDPTTGGTSRIALDGVARERVPISEFHTTLNMGEYYSAQPKGPVKEEKKASAKSGDYRYAFKTNIAVKPPGGDAAGDTATAAPALATAARPKGPKSPPATRDAKVPSGTGKATGTPVRKTSKKAE